MLWSCSSSEDKDLQRPGLLPRIHLGSTRFHSSCTWRSQWKCSVTRAWRRLHHDVGSSSSPVDLHVVQMLHPGLARWFSTRGPPWRWPGPSRSAYNAVRMFPPHVWVLPLRTSRSLLELIEHLISGPVLDMIRLVLLMKLWWFWSSLTGPENHLPIEPNPAVTGPQ